MSTMVKNIVGLIVCIVIVHLAYIGYIQPEAKLILEAAQNAGQSAPRNLVVILKDYEQELCIILMFWGVFLILGKCKVILGERYVFNVDLLEGGTGDKGDLVSVLKSLESLPIKVKNTPL